MTAKYGINTIIKAIISLNLLVLSSCGSGRVWVTKNSVIPERSNIAVVGFDMQYVTTGKPAPDISDQFSDAISPYFMESGFSIIERKKINLLLKELELQETGLLTEDKALKIGKLAKVSYVVYGTGKVKLGGSSIFLHAVTIKMVQVESGETILMGSWSGAGVRPIGVAERIGEDIVKEMKKIKKQK